MIDTPEEVGTLEDEVEDEELILPTCARCGEAAVEWNGRCGECRAIGSPFAALPDMWLLLPEIWTGQHAEAHATAVRGTGKYKSAVLTNFAVAMVLLEDWNIPPLSGNPETWDFAALELPLVAWIGSVVTKEYFKNFEVPKNSYAPSPVGRAALMTEGKPDGETATST